MFTVKDNSEVCAKENLDTLSHVGTISVVLTPVLSRQRRSNLKSKKKELRKIGVVSEEAVKGDVRSHVIGYV